MNSSFSSFEGNYKTRRPINLGGKRHQEDKEALVRKTQDLRKARENERQKIKSAIKIQVSKVTMFHMGINQRYQGLD